MKTKYDSTLSAANARSREQKPDAEAIRRLKIMITKYLSVVFVLSVLAGSPSSLQAQCAQWDVSGRWGMQQSNGYLTMLELHQNGKRITGTASYRGKTKGAVSGAIEKVNPVTGKFLGELEPGTTVTHKGAVSGSIEGNVFYVEISWEGGGGIYNGSVGSDGKISGNTYDRNKPSSKANWSSTAPMNCAPTPVSAAPAPPPKPIKSSGKAKPAATPLPVLAGTGPESGTKGGFIQLHTPAPVPPPVLSTQGEAEKSTRPYIRALPQIVSIPRDGSDPTTKLVWYAGNDHPNARLVVEVNGGDESLVDSQRKGSRQVKVKAGRRYVYSLVDAGEPLASVIVQTGQSASAPPERLRGGQREGRQRGESDNVQNQDDN